MRHNPLARPPKKKKKKKKKTTAAQRPKKPEGRRRRSDPVSPPREGRGSGSPRAAGQRDGPAAPRRAALTARGEPSASACAEPCHQWRAVDPPRCVTPGAREGRGRGLLT
ncbi:unnamed protein product [Coccothraustes coccothraustes]